MPKAPESRIRPKPNLIRPYLIAESTRIEPVAASSRLENPDSLSTSHEECRSFRHLMFDIFSRKSTLQLLPVTSYNLAEDWVEASRKTDASPSIDPGKRRRDFFSVESLREEVNEEISSEDIADTILTELRRINLKRVGNVSPDVVFFLHYFFPLELCNEC